MLLINKIVRLWLKFITIFHCLLSRSELIPFRSEKVLNHSNFNIILQYCYFHSISPFVILIPCNNSFRFIGCNFKMNNSKIVPFTRKRFKLVVIIQAHLHTAQIHSRQFFQQKICVHTAWHATSLDSIYMQIYRAFMYTSSCLHVIHYNNQN